jgi:hypothetical protein
MSTETQAPPAGGIDPNAAPESNAELTQPQGDEHQEGEAAGAGEDLTDDQRTIRKLLRRIDRLTAKAGGSAREAELLRAQIAEVQRQSGQEEPKAEVKPEDIERLASEKARDLIAQTTIAKRTQEVLTAGKKLDGFDAATNALADEVPFTDRQGRPTPFIEAVLDSDISAQLIHHLGNNPDEAAEFVGLSPAQIGRRLARLEDKLKQGAKEKTSNAPKPLEPVKGQKTEKAPSEMTDAEFNAWRRRQIAQRGR